VLQHVTCSRCHAPNLSTQFVCFACGAALKALPKRFRSAPAVVPWPLWAGLIAVLVALALVICHAAEWLTGLRQQAFIPQWHLSAGGAALIILARVAFHQARHSDRRWWGLRRAPEVRVAQSHTGDVVWVRGRLECDTPLVCPYLAQPCAYYRMVVREREPEQAGWRTVSSETNAVDFRVVAESDSVYVPTGGVLFDAAQYLDSIMDAGATQQVLVWALPVGMPVSLFGQVGGDTGRRRMDAPEQGLPVIATWRLPKDYVNLTGRRARLARAAGWVITMVGLVLLIGGVARA